MIEGLFLVALVSGVFGAIIVWFTQKRGAFNLIWDINKVLETPISAQDKIQTITEIIRKF